MQKMEKARVAVNGGMKLPIGYRFHPTDEELVFHYLLRKVFGFPLPASVIPVLHNVFILDPWNLPGDAKEKRYFFCIKERNTSNEKNCKKAAAGTGYWKPVGKGKQIVASANGQTVGIRKTMVLNGRKASAHQWVVHEYSLAGKHPKNTVEWVIYSVFERRRRSKNHGTTKSPTPTNHIRNQESTDCNPGCDYNEPSSPCCSGITDVSDSSVAYQEEEV